VREMLGTCVCWEGAGSVECLIIGRSHWCNPRQPESNRGAGCSRYHLPTSQLWEEGVRSSYFLPVKISIATKWHFAWPCFPVLDVATSTTCDARKKFKGKMWVRGPCVHAIVSSGTLQNTDCCILVSMPSRCAAGGEVLLLLAPSQLRVGVQLLVAHRGAAACRRVSSSLCCFRFKTQRGPPCMACR